MPADPGQRVLPPLIHIDRLTQSYGPVTVLDNVSLEVGTGEIHALLGANGAGKSTLIKVLAGLVPYTDGTIEVCGSAMTRGATGHQLSELGLAFVHQDLGLIDEMSVSENIALANGYRHRLGLIDFANTARRARAATTALGLDLDPGRLVGTLDQDAKVMVAVARAFALNARVIVLDEVSSSLPAPQVARLLEAIKKSTSSGLGYLYVTHRLDELFGLADHVTVLRDGRVAVRAAMCEVEKAQLVDAIVEPTLEAAALPSTPAAVDAAEDEKESGYPTSATTTDAGVDNALALAKSGSEPDHARLTVRDLLVRPHAEPISFRVNAGEIVAFCGLVGAGTRDVVRALGGDSKPQGGTAQLDQKNVAFGNPAHMRDAGCSYVPGNRQREGVVIDMSIRENVFLSRRGGKGQPGNQFVRMPADERKLADALGDLVQLRPAGSVERPMKALSGGNQQKIVCARALRVKPRLLVLDDPTAGVDIGSRAQIHHLIRTAAHDGAAIVFASTDYEEVAHLADRALVMVGGSVVAELSGPHLTENALARASYGGEA